MALHKLDCATAWRHIVPYNDKYYTITGDKTFNVSNDGYLWESYDLPTTNKCNDVILANGVFIVYYSDLDTDKYLYSNDGINWSEQTFPFKRKWFVCSANDIFFAGGNDLGTSMGVSRDGLTWTTTYMPSNADWLSVGYGNGIYVATGMVSQYFAWSSDLETWHGVRLDTQNETKYYVTESIFEEGNFYLVDTVDGNIFKTDGRNVPENIGKYGNSRIPATYPVIRNKKIKTFSNSFPKMWTTYDDGQNWYLKAPWTEDYNSEEKFVNATFINEQYMLITNQNIYYSSTGEGTKSDWETSPSILYTIQEHNEYNAYDKLYPKTHASLIVNPSQATGARIDVLCLPVSAGIVVNLSGQKTASATTDSNGKCSFEGLDYGEYIISATIGGSEKSETVNIDASKIYDVGLGVSKTLNDNSWEVISAVSSAGLASTYWSIGDCKNIVLNGNVGNLSLTGYNISVFILDFNHDSAEEGGTKDGITFSGFKNVPSVETDVALTYLYGSYRTGFYMNPTATNFGGWRGSSMRYYTLGSTNSNNNIGADTTTTTSPVSNSLMSCLTSELRAVMKPISTITYNYNDSTIVSTVDYLPLMSEYEVFGFISNSSVTEKNHQTQYQYYKNGNSTLKYRHDSTTSVVNWWLRSPMTTDAQFCTVDVNGTANHANAYYSYGIVPIFKV